MDGFDPNQVPDRVAIPSGNYNGIVIKSETKGTKTGGSQYVFTVKITEGEFAGAVIFWRLFRTGSGEKAVVAKQIADQSLKKLCLATIGLRKPNDTADFHNITCRWKIGQEEYNGATQNKIEGVESVNAAAPAKPAIPHPSQQSWNQAPAQQPAAGAPAGPVAAPWAKPATPPTA